MELKNQYPHGGPFLRTKCRSAHTLGGEEKWEKAERLGVTERVRRRVCLLDQGHYVVQPGTVQRQCPPGYYHTPSTRTTLVQEICDLLSEIWKPEVLCDCVDAGAVSCVGNCLQQSRRALGVRMTVGGGQSCTVTHPLHSQTPGTSGMEPPSSAPHVHPKSICHAYLLAALLVPSPGKKRGRPKFCLPCHGPS